jgi:hypothetical protein
VPGTHARPSSTVSGTITLSDLGALGLLDLAWAGVLLDGFGLELAQLSRGQRVAVRELAVVRPRLIDGRPEDAAVALDLFAPRVGLDPGLDVVDVVLIGADLRRRRGVLGARAVDDGDRRGRERDDRDTGEQSTPS